MDSEALTWAEFVAGWHDVFRDPVLCGTIGGAALGFMGVYVVLKRMVFVSAAVTGSAGLGVAFAFYLGIHHGASVDPTYSAVAFSVATMLLFLGEPRRVYITRESLLGLVFAVAGGLTLLIESRISQEAHDIHAILYGDAVLVRPADLWLITGASALLMTLHVVGFRGITFAVFDPPTAQVQGLPVRLLSAYVFVSVGIMVGVAARALGALPVFALTTLPAIAALVIGLRLKWTFVLAALFGAVCGGGGYLFATFEDFPVGGAQTVCAGALVLVALGVKVVRRVLQ